MRRSVAIASLGLALLSSTSRAERTVREISWDAMKREGALLGGDVVPGSSGAPAWLRVENPAGTPRAVPVFTLAGPGVVAPRYALRGDVRGEGIEGEAYLEMWSFFAGGGRYFSRTLAQAGPMASLHGSFGARPFLLPFTAEAGMKLEKLAVNVAFPGRGTVILGPMRLVELVPGEDFAGGSAGWLTPRGIGLAGAAAGSLLGVLGAAIGVLASKGRARGLVFVLLWSMIGLGLAALAAAALAWTSDQPPRLVFLLGLVGILAAGLPANLLGQVRRRYEEHELRRMQALDAR